MMMGKKKILIVEDEGLLARQISDELLQMGHCISAICASGEEALDAIEAEKPDVILMDIRLQGELDGIATASCIQKKYDIPIIYMSAYSEKSTIENAAMTEPYGFLVKPVNPRDLHVTIEIALYKHRTDREKAELKNKEIELLHVLSETNLFVRQIINCAQDGIVVFDLDLRFVIWNPFMEKLSGVAAAEVIGKHPLELFPFMRETGSVARLEKALVGETPGVVDFPYYVQQTGKSGWASDASAPLRNTHGDIIGVLAIIRDVSGRKRAEEALSESHAMMRQILDTLPQSIFWKDRDSVYMGCNAVFARAVGLENAEQIKGKTDFDLPWPKAEAEGYRRNDQKVIAGNRPKRHRIESMLQADGSRIWIDASKVPLLDREGHILGVLGVYEDITQRRNADEMLIKSERRLRESQEVARLGSWELDLVRQELEWSEETYKLFDKTREEFVPSFDEFARLVHPDDLKTMQNNFNRALENDDNPYHVAVRIINGSGREWVMEAFGAVRRDKDGKPLSIFGTAQDITDQKKTEEVLRQKEEMMRNLLDSVDEGFVVIDRDYSILSANRAYCNQVALDPSDVLGKHCFAVSHRREQPCFECGEECAIRKVFETGEPNACLHRHLDHDDETIFVETKAFPLKDSSGQVTSV
ncbi:MAG: PAS domain S-box protein, partial [Nitrospirae bacterium]|nr:PAS domain S-box protein [Nitrospirota bacterium]